MSNDLYSLGNGYLYSPWNGKLKEFKGEIWHREEHRDSRYIVPERTYFLVQDEQCRVIKKLQCSSVEGNVCNKVIWLREPNMRKAAEALIQYEESQISKLKLQIEKHEDLITMLKVI
jgi:hypothetical protein